MWDFYLKIRDYCLIWVSSVYEMSGLFNFTLHKLFDFFIIIIYVF